MCTDLRPVFPEERLLVEILLQKPFAYINSEVWASTKGRYYVDGESVLIPQELYNHKNAESVRNAIAEYAPKNSDGNFSAMIKRFIKANSSHLLEIVEEAVKFTRQAVSKYPTEHVVISFSGGKDSTVCADIVMQAIKSKEAVVLFGDTTLEYPLTYEYIERFKQNNPNVLHKTARNNEHNFFDMCQDIGVPSRYNRWCCTTFKTGPIAKEFSRNYNNKTVLSFIGARAAESSTRSNYLRLNNNSEEKKIQQQIPAYPIFYFSEADVWLYILSNDLDFNEAYRLGYKRIGCWLCPNGKEKTVFLNYLYYNDKATAWREQLLKFATDTGRTNIEDYVDNLRWTYRYGGTGLKACDDVIVKSIGCTTEENAKIYELKKPIRDSFNSFCSMFTPFGVLSQGRKLIDEVQVLDRNDNKPVLSIQPMYSGDYNNSAKIKVLTTKRRKSTERKVAYQIRKFNACRNCGKCDSICVSNAIKIEKGVYKISNSMCTRCQKCINSKYLAGGCEMSKVLRTKRIMP